MPQQVRQGLVLIVVAAAVFLPRLGATRLWDDDETYFAQVAREMYDRGDPIVPWFNQALFSHKPPFMYWMMIGAYHLFGITEFAARLPSALFGIANVLLLWRLGRILYSPGVGFWAGVALATSLNFVVISRAATCDAELIFFCTLPIYLFVRGTARRRPSGDGHDTELAWDEANSGFEPTWRTYTLVYATMGIAVMVKGPIGVVLPTAVLGLYLLCQSAKDKSHPVAQATGILCETFIPPIPTLPHEGGWEKRWLESMAFLGRIIAPSRVAQTIWRMRPLTALAMVLLVAGPWFVAVAAKTQGEFLTGFFGVHHFHRFTAPMDNHAGPFWFYLAAICVGFFPWIIFLSPSIVEFRRRIREGHSTRPADILICSWVVVWVGFFSLATTKFPHYVVPAYPALALFTACFLDRWTRHAQIYGPVARNAAWGTLAVAGLGILIVVPIVADSYLQGEAFLGLAGWPLLAGAALCVYFTERRQITRTLVSLTASAILFLGAIFGVAAVQVDRHQNTFPFAGTIRRHAPGTGARIATHGYFRPGLVYYCNERVEPLGEASAAAQFLQQNPERGFLVTTEAAYELMAGTLPPQVGILDRGPWFLKSGQTLLLLGNILGNDKDQRAVSDRRKTDGQRRE